MQILKKEITRTQAKDTAMAMVLILLLLGYFLENILYYKTAIPVLLLAMIIPNIFKSIAVIWLGLSHVLGTFVSKIVLSVVFFLLVTPVGLLRRLLGYDSLQLKKFKKGTESVLTVRNASFSPKEIERPF